MGNGQKVSPTIFESFSGKDRERDLGVSINGEPQTSIFLPKNPPPEPPLGHFMFENFYLKMCIFQFQMQLIFSNKLYLAT